MDMDLHFDEFSDHPSPLDHVEHVLVDNGWTYKRASDTEIALRLEGRACSYELFFIWHEELQALQLCCQYDLQITRPFIYTLHSSVAKINEKLWLGHFDVPQKTRKPCFRHTCLLRGSSSGSGIEQIEDMIDFSLQQCERYFSAFQLLASQDKVPCNDVISLALMETQGES